MNVEDLAHLSESLFKRLTGVKRRTYGEMCDLLRAAEAKQKARGGKPNRLSVELRLLMMLEYWR